MSMVSDVAHLSGLDQVRTFFDAGIAPPMNRTLGFELVDFGDGYAVFEGEPGSSVYNPIGSVHGGYAASILDSACGIAVHTKLAAGQAYTTLELKVSYHKSISDRTGKISARGTILSFGKRAAFAEAKLVDPQGVLLASATSSLLVITPFVSRL